MIGCASRTLHKHERNYAVVEKEALALIWAIGHFRCYLYKVNHPLKTDHKPLVRLKTVKEPKERLAKWLAILSEYEYTVQYIQGQLGADALSRMPDMPDTNLAEVRPAEERLDSVMLPGHVNSVGFAQEWSRENMAKLQREDSLVKSRDSFRESTGGTGIETLS